ncbi:MAG: M23 family metallopeptidase [Phycisphaeraceae bacterium]|nr:M23 family metallopeptidase [Phycisphaerales bacterium]MCB9859686.1 M23 family metallopeptidase [Phycisphaeraceae bacterium]
MVVGACVSLALIGTSFVATPDDVRWTGPIGGPVYGVDTHDNCVPSELRDQLETMLAEYHTAHPAIDVPALYRFFPQAGEIYGDLSITNYVDLDASGGILDYECGAISYNGHAGHDVIIRSWSEQDIGVPIFAVAPGTVLFANDGEFDKNTTCNGNGNYVIIDHGDGREGWYFHMQNGSVAVSPGQMVVEGQQIGNTASSGCSTYPHLHFESHQAGIAFEPNVGSCNPGTSAWVNQLPYQTEAGVLDFGVTATNLGTVAFPPEPSPREGQIALSTQSVYFWVMLNYLPAQSTWRVRWIDPNGGVQRDSGTVAFGNPDPYPFAWYYWWNDPIFQTQLPGDWRIVLDINGQNVIDAPVQAVTTINPALNRPPEPISVSFDPAVPESGHAIYARVQTSNWKDDLDWDVVRYHYVWKVNGSTVRDVITAGRADAIAANTWSAGDTVEVCVTPSDGAAAGGTVCISSGACYPDCDGSGSLNIFDYICFGNAYSTNDPYADCDGSGSLNIFDYICFGNAYAVGCP